MNARNRTLLFAAAVLACVIASFALLRGPSMPARTPASSPAVAAPTTDQMANTAPAREAEPDSTAAPLDSRAVATGADSGPGGSAAAVAPAVLPPPDTPLANMIGDLEQRARNGDVRAACRLAAELSRCASLAQSRAIRGVIDPTRRAGSAPSNPGIDMQVDIAARLDLQIEASEKVCAGISREQTRAAVPWLYSAAQGGIPSAQASFAGGGWAMQSGIVHHPEMLSHYAADAQRFAESAIAAGDLSMMADLGLALSGIEGTVFLGAGGMLVEVVKPDPVRARALLLALTQENAMLRERALVRETTPQVPRGGLSPEQTLQTLSAELSAADLAASEAQAAQLRANLPPAEPRKQNNASILLDGNAFIRPSDCER